MEPKASSVVLPSLANRLGFRLVFILSSGNAWGYALFIKQDFQFKVAKQNHNLLAVEFCNMQGSLNMWLCCFVYAPPYLNEKQNFWSYFSRIFEVYGSEWVPSGPRLT